MNEELQGIVEKMVAAGESEEDIALVIREYKPAATNERVVSPVENPHQKTDNIIMAGISGLNRGVSGLVSGGLKMLGAVNETLSPEFTPEQEQAMFGGPRRNVPLEAGQALEDFSNKINYRYEDVNQTFQDVAEGAGQAAGMMATAGAGVAGQLGIQAPRILGQGIAPAIGRAAQEVGKQVVSPVGFLGGSITAVPEWEAAKAAGLSDDDAFNTLIKNYLVGQTDAIPITNFLSRWNKITNGSVMERVRQFGTGGLQEFLQEGFQTYLTNQIAKSDYDPDRDPMFQVLESASVGGMVGLLFPGIAVAMGNASPQVREKLARKQVILEANAEIAKADSGDPAVNTDIDKQVDEVTNTITETAEGTSSVTSDIANKTEVSDKNIEQDPITLTDTSFPIYDAEGNDTGKKKPAKQFTITLPGVGDAKGTIVGNQASILEIFAEKDEEGNAKKGGGLYGKVINNLKKKGVKQIVVGLQSPASTAALQGMVRKGTLSVTPGSIDKGETDMHGNPIRFNIESDLVTEFDQTGALLGGAEESRGATKAAATEQIADFLRGKVKSRGEVTDFADSWNLKHPERPITDAEVRTAWDLIRPAKVDKGEVITAPVNELLKDQIKTFYKGVEKGVRKGQKLVNETLIPKVQEALKGTKLTPRQTHAILNRLKSSNLFTPGSVSKLNTFIDKVVADAEYAEKLADGRSLQKRTKKFGRQKNPGVPVNLKILARSFGQIDPSEVADLDEYIERANSIIAAFRPVKAPNYAMVDETDTQDWIEKVLDAQEEQQEKELKQAAEEDVEELRAIAQGSLDRLADKDLGGFDAAGQRAVETIKKIDIKQLTPDQLKRFVRIVDNIVVNDDLSGEAFIENIAAVQEFIKDFSEMTKNIKVSQMGAWARTMYNLSNMMKRLYQNDKVEAFIRAFVHGPILTAGSKVEAQVVEVSQRFDREVKRINKKYKTEVRDINNKADMMVFSLLYQMDNGRDMAKMHRNIKETIRRNREVGNTAEADAWDKAYKAFETVTSAQEASDIINRKNPAIREMWNMFGNDVTNSNGIFTEEISEEQARVTKELHNREYATVVRYTPIVQRDVNTLYKTSQNIQEEEAYSPNRKIDPTQSRTAKRRTLNLAANKVYTLEPYTDWILRFGETIYRNKASKAEARMGELIRHPEFTRLMGGTDNALALAEAFERMVNIQRGTNRLIADNEAETFFTEIAKTFRSIGTVKALASFSQAVKQSTVSVKLVTNLMVEGDADVLPAAIHAVASIKQNESNGVKKLLDQSTLIVRGLRMGATDRGTSEAYKLQRSATRWFSKRLENARITIDKRTRASLSLLVKPDVFNARLAFVSYYLQSLKHQGVRDVDLNTEHSRLEEKERKLAMAYAENMVEKTQTASNPAAMSAIQAQTQSKGWEFVKTVFLPFSTFDSDFKARFVNEVSATRRSPSAENMVRLGGTVGEALTFAALNAFMLYWYKEFLRNLIASLTSVERPEQTEEETAHRKNQQFLSSVTGALNPIAIGTVPQELQAWAINEVGYQIAATDKPELTKKEWLKENAYVYEPREGSLLENLGAYSTGITPLTEMIVNTNQLGRTALGKPVTLVDAYGNQKVVMLTSEQQHILFLKTVTETLTLAGLTEADIANAIRTVHREAMKNAEAAPKKNTKKQFKRKRKSFRRDE